ncbi:MAG: protoporphyrinogen oxidase HemJ [Gammaproteobacteria bacterium]
MYLWIKAFHLITVVTWFAGLFYLPRLFVYHAMASDDPIGIERFKVMERKLYYGIMTPSVLITAILGGALIYLQGIDWLAEMKWLQLKLVIVALLIIYHAYLGVLLNRFKRDENVHSHVFYRWINELPVLVLVTVVCLAIIKPDLW